MGEWDEALAHHWSQTRRVDKAVRYMGLAGEKSLRLYAVEEAHERFRRVVQLVEAHPGYADDRFLADVLLAWCRTYYYLKDVPNFIALSRYLPRVEALDDRRRLSLFLFWIGFAHVFPPFPDKARPLLERALSLGEALGDDECIGYACMGLTFLHLIKPEPTARELALRGLACGERLGDVYLMSKCLLGLVNYDSFTGRYQRAREFALRGVDVGRRAGDPRATALGLGAMAIVNLSEERFTEAVENIEEALRISPDPLDRVAQRLIKGVALGLTGETAAGVAMAREGIRDLQAADAGEVAAWFEVPFGVALVLSGQLATGVRWIEETIPRAVKVGRVWRIAAAHLVLGEIYLEMALGEKKSPLPVLLKNAGFILKRLPFARRLARRHLRDAAHCARQADFPGVLARSLFDLGVLARRSKRFEEARRCFNDARVLADPHSATLTQRIREALASLP